MEWPDHRPRIQHRWPEPRPLRNRRPGIGLQRVGLRRGLAGSAGLDAPPETAEFDRAAVDRSSCLEINMVPLIDICRFRRTRIGPPQCTERAVLPAILMEQPKPHQAVSLASIACIRQANIKRAPGFQVRHFLRKRDVRAAIGFFVVPVAWAMQGASRTWPSANTLSYPA